jgi:hypothetical protein
VPLHHRKRQMAPRVWVCVFPPYRTTQRPARSNCRSAPRTRNRRRLHLHVLRWGRHNARMRPPGAEHSSPRKPEGALSEPWPVSRRLRRHRGNPQTRLCKQRAGEATPRPVSLGGFHQGSMQLTDPRRVRVRALRRIGHDSRRWRNVTEINRLVERSSATLAVKPGLPTNLG